jgi:hypothetical protein
MAEKIAARQSSISRKIPTNPNHHQTSGRNDLAVISNGLIFDAPAPTPSRLAPIAHTGGRF